MKFRSKLLAATVLAVPGLTLTGLTAPAAAQPVQPVSGIYIGGGIGANFMQDESINFGTGAFAGQGRLFNSDQLSLDTGFVGLASVGYGFGNGLRVEIEGNYRNNSIGELNGAASRFGPVRAGGTEQKYGAMANVLYDLAFIPYVHPYVGVGAGYVWSNFSSFRAYDNVGTELRADDTDGSFAAQGILGLAFPVAPVPGLALTLEYRFLALVQDRDYKGSLASFGRGGVAPGIFSSTVRASDDYNHSVLVGVRYAFNAAPPPVVVAPAAPAPAVQPARSYLVFFDWDRYNLTDRARQIVREAAENSTRVQYTQIKVNGYTDTSGTPRYNQRLSIRRAETVAAELVKNGVARNAISIQGFGETHLLVPTGPNVREPQNRRVEIIIQ